MVEELYPGIYKLEIPLPGNPFEIEDIIRTLPRTVRDTAAAMHWNLRYDRWEDFPNPQKWFASGEAMAHLEHLYLTGKAERSTIDGVLYYKLK